MSFRRSFAVAAFTIFVAITGTASRTTAAEAAPANKATCSAFKVSPTSSTKLFQSQATLESTLRKDATIPIYIPKLCCYKYLGCFIC